MKPSELKKDDVVMVTRHFDTISERFFARVTQIEMQSEEACFFCYEPVEPPSDRYGRTTSMEGPFGNVAWLATPKVTCSYLIEVEIVGEFEYRVAHVMGATVPVRRSGFLTRVRKSA